MDPIDLVKGVFKTEGATTAVVLGGAILASVPQKLLSVAFDGMTSKVVVPGSVRYYTELCRHLEQHSFKYLSNSLSINDRQQASLNFGTSYTKLLGTPVSVLRAKEGGDKGGESLTITFYLTSKQDALAKLEEFSKSLRVDDVVTTYRKRIDIFKANGKEYDYVKSDYVRPEGSMFMDQTTMTYINERIDKFLSRKTWYLDRGIPYKYAILLHGIPGTGKTTLAKYIAGRLNRSLFILNPVEVSMHTGRMARMVALMEDIDCDMGTGARSGGEDGGGFMLGDLLNAIDGVNCVDDCVMIATTNHVGKIDPALLRKGRFDDVIEIKPLETQEIQRMVSFFFDGAELTGWSKSGYHPTVGANIQDEIMNYYDDGPAKVIEVLNAKYGKDKPKPEPKPEPELTTKSKPRRTKKRQETTPPAESVSGIFMYVNPRTGDVIPAQVIPAPTFE